MVLTLSVHPYTNGTPYIERPTLQRMYYLINIDILYNDMLNEYLSKRNKVGIKLYSHSFMGKIIVIMLYLIIHTNVLCMDNILCITHVKKR